MVRRQMRQQQELRDVFECLEHAVRLADLPQVAVTFYCPIHFSRKMFLTLSRNVCRVPGLGGRIYLEECMMPHTGSFNRTRVHNCCSEGVCVRESERENVCVCVCVSE